VSLVEKLNHQTSNYWDIQKLRIAISNRQEDLIDDADVVTTLKSLEGKLARDIGKLVHEHPMWGYWLKDLFGIGEVMAGQLICLVTGQVHTPECQVKRDAYYSKKVKGEGKREARYVCDCPLVEIERFPTVSSLWKYAGMHVVDGKAPRRKRGEKVDWNPRFRSLCYNIGKSFVINTKGPYRQHYDRFKAEDTEKHPDLSKGHLDARARRKTVKLFLSHLYMKWYELKGLTPTQPYVEAEMGHTHIIPPP